MCECLSFELFESQNRFRGLHPQSCIGKSQKVTRGSYRNDVSPLTQGLRYRAACDIPEIFAYNRGFSEWCNDARPILRETNSLCHGNEIWDKVGYNSAYIRDIHEIFAYNKRFLGVGLLIDARKFYCDQPPLPWQRNLGQNRV